MEEAMKVPHILGIKYSDVAEGPEKWENLMLKAFQESILPDP